MVVDGWRPTQSVLGVFLMSKQKDLTGQRFGRWTVLNRAENRKSCWLCRCNCGTERPEFSGSLKDGTSKSCGSCLPSSNHIDLTGQRFGRWTVIRPAEPHGKNRAATYLCRCDCGTERIVLAALLKSGKSKSCGCLHRDKAVAYQTSKRIDLTGQQFNGWTVIQLAKLSGPSRQREANYLCRCNCCGTERIIRAALLKNGKSPLCKIRRRKRASDQRKNLTGQIFGKLTVI